MIDLSYLTEEEQEMIMTVLKRDVDLKKANEDRIKQLQKLDPETEQMKYITGEWFYEAKSQRHDDRIHGSDMIMASMRHKKPMTVDFSAQSWRDRPSRSNNVMNPKPEMSGSCSLEGDQQDRRDTQDRQDMLKRPAASRPRHNPFNTEPMDTDYEKMDNQLTNGATAPEANEYAEVLSLLKSDEAVTVETKNKVPDTFGETVHREKKPIPKRRTKIPTLQSTVSDSTSSVSSQSVSASSDNRSTMSPESSSSVFAYLDNTSTMSPESTPTMSACSDDTSTVSTPSVSVSSGLRSPPPRGILKHNSSTSGSNIKSQLPRPLRRLDVVPATTGSGQGLDKHSVAEERTEESFHCPADPEPVQPTSPVRSGLPKSRLPVRSPLTLNTPVQTAQEKPSVFRQQSSGTWSNNDHKTIDTTHTTNPNYNNNNSMNCSSAAEPETQEMSDEILKEPLTLPSVNVRSALEGRLDKESSEAPLPKPERAEKKISKKEREKAGEHGEPAPNTADQHGYDPISTEVSARAGASYTAGPRTADAPLEYKSRFSPPAVNAKRKDGETRVKTQNYQHPVKSKPQSPQAIEEQGASIAKVLEWFNRSSDSSEKLDHEDNAQDMDDDIKMEDIDFESEREVRGKRSDNIYLIIPRQSEDNTVDDVFLKSWEKELDVDVAEHAGTSQHGEQGCDFELESTRQLPVDTVSSAVYSSFENVTNTNMDVSGEVGSPEKVADTEEENSSPAKMDSTTNKVIGDQPEECLSPEEDQTPTVTNLLSFWEKSNTGPKTSRSGVNNEKDKNLVKYKVGRDFINYREETPKSPVAETKKQVKRGKDVLNEGESHNVAKENLSKHGNVVRDECVKDKQPPWSYANQKRDRMVCTSFSGTNVGSLLQKPRSASLDSECILDDQSSERVIVATDKNCREGDHRIPAKLDFGHRTRSEGKESKAEPSSPVSPGARAKQGEQEEESRSEKIKRLRSFWEKEKWQHRKYVKSSAVDDVKSPMKLNKRLSKSEFDLRTIGPGLDDEPDDSMAVPNFAVLPMRDRTEKTVPAEGINRSQFKTLREFWAESSKQSSKIETPLSPKVKQANADTDQEAPAYSPVLSPVESKLHVYQSLHPNQSDKINLGGFGNERRNTKPAKTEGEFEAPLKERTVPRRPDSDTETNFFYNPSGEVDLLELSQFPQRQGDSHTRLKDTGLPTHPRETNKEFQARMISKEIITGKGNSLQRDPNMFEVNMDNEDPDLHLKSKKGPETNLPPLRKTTKTSTSPSRQMAKADSMDTDSQPFDSTSEPGDSLQYLEGMVNTYASPRVTGQSELVCTPFQTPPETGCGLRCSSAQAGTPPCALEACDCSGRPELRGAEDDLGRKTVDDDAWTHSQTRSNRDKESVVQEALRRAAARPVYHKSLQDLNAVPKPPRKSNQPRKSDQEDDFLHDSDNNFNCPSSPSSSFSNSERLKNLSRSVPSFLQETDGGVSDCSSGSGSLSSTHWRNGPSSSRTSGMTSLSSVSGSVMSVYSTDFTGVEVQGSIQFSIIYIEKLKELHIFVDQCQNLAAVDLRRNRTDPYVKSYLVPDSANLGKRKTSVKKKTLNPTYKEILRYRAQIEYLRTQVLNLSVWHNDTFGRNCFLGETEVDFSTWDFGNTNINSMVLQARHLPSQISGGLQPEENRGEMRLAVRFLPQVSRVSAVPNSSEVHVWIKECKNLPQVKGAATDPYVKCVVLPDTSKKGRQKTRVLKRTTHPVFNHTMVYDGFRQEDLKEACVELTVWHQDRLASRLIGGIRLSLGTGISYGVSVNWLDSTAEEVALWARMMDCPGEWVGDTLPLRVVTRANITGK